MDLSDDSDFKQNRAIMYENSVKKKRFYTQYIERSDPPRIKTIGHTAKRGHRPKDSKPAKVVHIIQCRCHGCQSMFLDYKKHSKKDAEYFELY